MQLDVVDAGPLQRVCLFHGKLQQWSLLIGIVFRFMKIDVVDAGPLQRVCPLAGKWRGGP